MCKKKQRSEACATCESIIVRPGHVCSSCGTAMCSTCVVTAHICSICVCNMILFIQCPRCSRINTEPVLRFEQCLVDSLLFNGTNFQTYTGCDRHTNVTLVTPLDLDTGLYRLDVHRGSLDAFHSILRI